MQVRSIAPLAATCALLPLLLTAALMGSTSTPSLAQGQTTTPTTTQTGGLSASALLQATTQTPQTVVTRTPTPTATPQATATPTLAPASSTTTLAQVFGTTTTTPSTSIAATTSATDSTATGSPTPFVASLVSPSFASAASSPDSGVSNPAPVSSAVPVAGPQGLPDSAIFVPGGSATSASTASASSATNSTSQAGSVDQVVDATQGGTLVLPDKTLELVIPGGVADTDFLVVSLTEVAPSSASGNLQVGSRRFALTVVDSGGGTVTNFGTPILVTATTAAQPAAAVGGAGSAVDDAGSTVGGAGSAGGIAALDPDSGRFSPILADAQAGQLTGSLDKLAAPATTGVPDAPLASASTAGKGSASSGATTRGAAPQQQQQSNGGGSGGADPSQILSSLGLRP